MDIVVQQGVLFKQFRELIQQILSKVICTTEIMFNSISSPEL